MTLHFIESNAGSMKVLNYSTHKRGLVYHLLVEVEKKIKFHNHLSKSVEEINTVKVEARGFKKFFKFYNHPSTEVYVVSIVNNAILDIAELTND